MMLLFDQRKLPRTMTRAEWREIDRWRRVTQQKLAAETSRQIQNIGAFGVSHPEIALRMAENFINPPVLIGPYQ